MTSQARLWGNTEVDGTKMEDVGKLIERESKEETHATLTSARTAFRDWKSQSILGKSATSVTTVPRSNIQTKQDSIVAGAKFIVDHRSKDK